MRATTEFTPRALRGGFGVRVHLLDLPLTRVGESLWWQAARGPVFRTRRKPLRIHNTLSVVRAPGSRWAAALYFRLRVSTRVRQ